MLKLYKRIEGVLHYREAWAADREIIEHWGPIGERGDSKKHKLSKQAEEDGLIEQILAPAMADGYAPLPEDGEAILLIEYAIDGFGTKKDLKKRHALEDRLNETLGWTGLGNCDGGSTVPARWKSAASWRTSTSRSACSRPTLRAPNSPTSHASTAKTWTSDRAVQFPSRTSEANMSAISKPKKRFTEDEYLAIEGAAEFKSEFYDGVMFEIAGANLPHIRISRNLSVEIGIRLRGGPCESFSSEMRVKVKTTGLYTYPDIVIVCGEPEIERRSGLDTLLNPKVVIEIASKSTEGYDRGPKFKQYKRLASVKEYVIVSSDRMSVDRFVRQANGKWLLTTFDKPSGKMILETVPGVRIPLADVYRGVEFPESPGP